METKEHFVIGQLTEGERVHDVILTIDGQLVIDNVTWGRNAYICYRHSCGCMTAESYIEHWLLDPSRTAAERFAALKFINDGPAR